MLTDGVGDEDSGVLPGLEPEPLPVPVPEPELWLLPGPSLLPDPVPLPVPLLDPEIAVEPPVPRVWSRLTFVVDRVSKALRLKPHVSVTMDPSLHQAMGGLLKAVHPEADVDFSIPKWMLTEAERRTPLFWS